MPNMVNAIIVSFVVGAILITPLVDVYGRRILNLVLTAAQTITLFTLAICLSVKDLNELTIIFGL